MINKLIILSASIISICMLVCFPRISHVNPLVSHSRLCVERQDPVPDITQSAAREPVRSSKPEETLVEI